MRSSEEPRRTPVLWKTILRSEGKETLPIPMAQKSGARSIVPMDMIWKSAKLFWIVKECHHQQRRHLNIPIRESITERSPTEMSTWKRLM
jgi:hypothetical protein